MKAKYLFPPRFKKYGLMVLIPSIIMGLFMVITGYEPALFDAKVFALFVENYPSGSDILKFTNNNIFDEIIAVLLIVSALLVTFSKEKDEDEYIQKIRLESLVWATYANYAVLLLAIVFVYDLSFLWVMIFNMFTLLVFFIIRFNWKISKMKNLTPA